MGFFLSGKCPSTNQIINFMLDLKSQISKEETQYATERNTASDETEYQPTCESLDLLRSPASTVCTTYFYWEETLIRTNSPVKQH